MSFAAANSTSEPRSFSIGPLKIQVLTYSVASGDTSGTITADSLSSISHVLLDGGLVLSAAPTFAANVATLAFVNPAATRYGTIMVCGK